MKKYFIVENNQQTGPFSKDELKQKQLEKSTLVWCEGMANWQEAGTVSDLNELFIATPPPPPKYQAPPSPPPYQAPPPPQYRNNANRNISGANNAGGLIALAYILALLGGLGGIIIGSIIWMGKEDVNGTKMSKYRKSSQLHGVFSFFLGIIIWSVTVEFLLK